MVKTVQNLSHSLTVSVFQNFCELNLYKQLHAILLINPIIKNSFWLPVIKGYVHNKQPQDAIVLYSQLHRQEKKLPHQAIPLVFKAWVSLSLLPCGRTTHTQVLKSGLDSDLFIGTAMIDFYAKFGELGESRRLFDEMPKKNVVSWNALIGGYAKSGDMESAFYLFERMPEKSSVTWTEMIDGYSRQGKVAKARALFDAMPHSCTNVVNWTVMVNACATNGEMDQAEWLFGRMPKRNFFVWSSMMVGFCRSGNLKKARALFDRMPSHNLVNWNALISGYSQNGRPEAALALFIEMRNEGMKPDEVTIVGLLSACGQLGSLNYGKEVEALIDEFKINRNQFVSNALIDMYAKCGDLCSSLRVFNKMDHRNVICWNSMISGLAAHGQSEEAVKLFEQMVHEGVKPNGVTFVGVLSACSHGGYVKMGHAFFKSMRENYGLKAEIEHYGCMVDLLGRAGKLEEAYELIESMPINPNTVIWGTMLGACRIHMDMEIAKRVVDEAAQTKAENDVHYVILANIYAASDRWEQAEKLRQAMVENRVRKTPGCSSVVVDGTEHQFMVC
ncbi:hypothetical protein AMTRI_Chr11g157370 [Amborella trichopoda]